MNPPTLAYILQRDRMIVIAGLAGIVLLAWGYMLREAAAMGHTGVCQCFGMKMAAPDTAPWSAREIVPLSVMWAGMMVAMMVPSVAPTVLTFAAVSRKRKEQQRPYAPAGMFLLGYLTVWTICSIFLAIAQWTLHSVALLSSAMIVENPVFGANVLIMAGAFQFTPVKNRCLQHCRSPLDFLMTSWREGAAGAFKMGLQHGAYCTGCCWLLMLLLFVAGVMNMWWVATISIFVLVEKLAPKLNVAAGALLIAWGVVLLLKVL